MVELAGSMYEEDYIRTLKFYKEMFQAEPPEDVWGFNDLRYDPKTAMLQNINFFRLAVMYCMKSVNPLFLIPQIQDQEESGLDNRRMKRK